MNLLTKQDRYRERPVRQCALTRSCEREDELLRFVLDPESQVVVDIKRKLPGRGVWITATKDALIRACGQKIFSKAFRQPVNVDHDLPDRVERLLRRAALQDLALANKAGSVVAGFTKVEKAVKARTPVVLFHACDAARDGCDKLDRLAQGVPDRAKRQDAPLSCLTSEEVSVVLGRANVMHMAIEKDGAGRRFLWSVERFMRYVGTPPETAEPADEPEQDWV